MRRLSPRFYEFVKMAETGLIMPVSKFDIQVFKEATSLVKEHDIKFNSDSVVPTDRGLIKDVFDAGLELLLRVGLLCTNTERVIKFTKQDVDERMAMQPREMSMGEGTDAATMYQRDLEDKRPPFIVGAPFSIPISEAVLVKLYEALVSEPLIQAYWTGVLEDIQGMTVRGGSPMEMHAEIANIFAFRAASLMAGRPGITLLGKGMSTAQAHIGATMYNRKTEPQFVSLFPELKTDFGMLCKASHFMDCGFPIQGWASGFSGGYAGGIEGATIAGVANALAQFVLFGVGFVGLSIFAITDIGQSRRDLLWGVNLQGAALNSHGFMTANVPYTVHAGPCTPMCFYETAACSIGHTAVGSNLGGVASREGKKTDYVAPLDARFMAEVGYASTGMKLEDANEIVKQILPQFEKHIQSGNIPAGKKFQECYDLRTLKPIDEYVLLYKNAKRELENLGIPFKL